MVPTYATAIGSSSDRPVALAELVGILVNDGVRRPTQSLTNVHFASGTPYETLFQRSLAKGDQVLDPEIASIVRQTMILRSLKNAITSSTWGRRRENRAAK